MNPLQPIKPRDMVEGIGSSFQKMISLTMKRKASRMKSKQHGRIDKDPKGQQRQDYGHIEEMVVRRPGRPQRGVRGPDIKTWVSRDPVNKEDNVFRPRLALGASTISLTMVPVFVFPQTFAGATTCQLLDDSLGPP